MNSNPLVSVIVPYFNASQFIREAVESVFNQTYYNWELLLVDDGSTDGSYAIADHYAAQHPGKVCCLAHKGHRNLGSSASRNLGIRQAKGELIAFLDADDVWLPQKLERQIAIFDAQPEAAMVYGNSRVWYSWTEKPEDKDRDFVPDFGMGSDLLILPRVLLIRILQMRTRPPSPSGVMVKRTAAVAIGGFEEAFRGLYDDQVFFAKISLRFRIFLSAECWHLYRQHDNSCCHLRTDEQDTVRRDFFDWLEQYMTVQSLKGTDVWKALQERLRPYRHPYLHRLTIRPRLLFSRLSWVLRNAGRAMLGRSVGSISAYPNPILVVYGAQTGDTALSWSSRRTEHVEVRVNAPDGPLFSHSGPAGNAQTGDWIYDGTVFFLQDVSGGLPLLEENTLSAVRVYVARRKKFTGQWGSPNNA